MLHWPGSKVEQQDKFACGNLKINFDLNSEEDDYAGQLSINAARILQKRTNAAILKEKAETEKRIKEQERLLEEQIE